MSGVELSAADFRVLYDRVKQLSRWGPAGRRGALNNISPAERVAAASEVRYGRVVLLAARVENHAAPDNPDPAVHQMTQPRNRPALGSGLSFTMDRMAMNVHGYVDSHIDALCHVIFDGTLYNGVAADAVTAEGPTGLSIKVASDGIVGRGLLLDIPRVRRLRRLEPGEYVTAEDLLAAEALQEARIRRGDLLFVRRWSFPRAERCRPMAESMAAAGARRAPVAVGGS